MRKIILTFLVMCVSMPLFAVNTAEQLQKLVASDRGEDDGFGSKISISGDYAIVGVYNEDEDEGGANTLSNAGSAHIYLKE